MIGRQLAHYRIVARAGAGAMGEVYRAEDERLKRAVALKILPEEMARDLAVPLTGAVAAAHDRGIVHRDLKPSNVMVTTEGAVKVRSSRTSVCASGSSTTATSTTSATIPASRGWSRRSPSALGRREG